MGANASPIFFPIEEDGQIIGAIGTIVFRNLQRVKRMFAGSDSGGPDDLGEIYNSISRIESGYTFHDFVGEDPTVKDLIEKSKESSRQSSACFDYRRDGTGKEIIAGAIHNRRYNEQYAPYVTINCTAIPENLLESELFGHEKEPFTGADAAKPGKFEVQPAAIFFLDEIGDMSLFMQSKLLRVLESKEFERVGSSRIIPLQAGIIASTNKNLFLSQRGEEIPFRPLLPAEYHRTLHTASAQTFRRHPSAAGSLLRRTGNKTEPHPERPAPTDRLCLAG